MHFSVFEQEELLREAFIFGLFIGAFYDVFRLLRAMGFNSARAVFLQDICFMACASAACFMFAQTTVHGRFRLFIMIGHASGAVAYRVTAGIVTGVLFRVIGKLYKAAYRGANSAIIAFARKITAFYGKIRLFKTQKQKFLRKI